MLKYSNNKYEFQFISIIFLNFSQVGVILFEASASKTYHDNTLNYTVNLYF